MKGQDPVALLRRTELFRGLDEPHLVELSKRLMSRGYTKGTPLFHQGDPGESLYIVVDGTIAVYVTSENGERMVLTTLRPPDVLGEIALLDGGNRSASAEAMETSAVYVLPRGAFVETLRANPQLAETLMHSFGTMVRRLSEQASDFVFLDLPGRVAKVLVRLAEDRDAGSGAPVEIAVTQGRLAEMVGGSRQSVNQILQTFAGRGILEVHGRRLLVSRLEALRKRAGLAEP